MVKIPALELDGRNWKIYRVKYLEVTATHHCLDVLAGRPDDGTDDWEWCNTLLCSLFMETVPASIYYQIRLKSAHETYNYLAKHFRDNDPIQELCAKKFVTRANEDKRYSSAESPMNENAATERHAHAEREDPPTKALTRGNEDVDDRNVGRTQDPRTSLEALAKGNSAKSAGTTVLLKSAPHETQDQPQDSLQATPWRLPIEDEPSECEQEAAESLVTAERTKGTVEKAEPRETVTDVDGNAVLGREPVERVHRVDEGDEERDGQLQLQQTDLCCKDHQRNRNATKNVPKAHGVPLVGEWEVCVSGETKNSCAESSSESMETESTAGVESKGCEGGASERARVGELNATAECCQQLCMAHGDPGYEAEPTGTLNESDALVITSIMSEEPGGGGIPRVHLRVANWRAGSTNGPGRRTDGSTGETDGLRGQTDALNASNGAETAGMSDGEGAETYLGVRDAKRVVNATNGVRRHADALTGPTDVPSVETDAVTPANVLETVSIP